MRQLVFYTLFLVVISALTHACNQGNKTKPNGYGKGHDSTYTVVTYVRNPMAGQYKTSNALRVSKDTVMPDPADKTRNIPARDTAYWVYVEDPALDSAGTLLKRKNGMDSTRGQWMQAARGFIVHDYNFHYQTLIQK